ncbi:MAG: hypothetical protein J6Z11_04955, partial [Candidatus Riflebacteria bacterium]|nr:hypothetical protein [Candidatus Riflebacteria bacterium]
ANEEQVKSEIESVDMSGADTGLEIYGNNISVGNYTARYCKTGLAILTASGTYVAGLDLEDCETGVKAESSYYCTISDIVAKACKTAIELNNNTGLRLSHFDVRNCQTLGVNSNDKKDTTIRNGLIHSFGNGLSIAGNGCNAQFITIDALNGILLEGADEAVIRNNIIVNNVNAGTGTGIEDMSGSGNAAFPYNNIYGFSVATKNCTQSGASIYNTDPMFVGYQGSTYNYHLKENSGLLNVASNNGQIGAYGAD